MLGAGLPVHENVPQRHVQVLAAGSRSFRLSSCFVDPKQIRYSTWAGFEALSG